MAYAFHRIQKGLEIDAILRMTDKTEENGMNGQFELKRQLEAKILQLQNENMRLRRQLKGTSVMEWLANLQTRAIRALQVFCVAAPAFSVLIGVSIVIALGIGAWRAI